jgi:hypothetical protein
MKIVLYTASLFLLALLTGCATLDPSLQETALTLEPGEIEVTPYAGSGLSTIALFNPQFIRENQSGGKYEFTENPIVLGALGTASHVVTGVKVGVPVGSGLDIVGRLYTAGAGITAGGKAGVKYLIMSKYNDAGDLGNYLSVIPTLGFSYLTYWGDPYGTNWDLGAECQLAWSWFHTEDNINTLALRVNYDHMYYDGDEDPRENLDSFHGGITWNKRIKIKSLYLTPEAGLDIFSNSQFVVFPHPFASLGVSWKL